MEGIPIPALLSLLSSTSDLVNLHLDDIPLGGYILPEAMVTCLATLPRLKYLFIGQSAISHLDRIHLPPVTWTLLPALTSFDFRGVSEYPEELISRINSSQLNQIYIKYLDQFFDFRVAQLFKFIERSEDPKLTLIRYAKVTFSDYWVTFEMMYQHPKNLLDASGPVSALIYC